MKALTVRQPWAFLIVHGFKDIENRTWGTKHRGPLLIQASARTKAAELQAARDYARARGIVIPEALPMGGIVGIVELRDCVRSHQSVWFEGPMGWVLSDARPLPFVACSGKLYLFDAPEAVTQQLPAEVRRFAGR